MELGRKAEKQYAKLPKKLLGKVRELFKMLEINPWPARLYDLEKLEGVNFQGYRIRLGKVRVMYAVLEDEKRIIILKIEQRKTVYRGS